VATFRHNLFQLLPASVGYVLVYLFAGYFVAWQNPELRAFYGHPGPALPFVAHLANTWHTDSMFFPFQLFRGAMWSLCAIPIILTTRTGFWATAALVAVFLSLPQNLVHLLANPLMPLASVRLSHLVETVPSMMIFGVILVWLYYPRRPSSTIHHENRRNT